MRHSGHQKLALGMGGKFEVPEDEDKTCRPTIRDGLQGLRCQLADW